MTHDEPDSPRREARRKYIAHSKNERVVPLPVSPYATIIPKWNSTHEAPGWTLFYADMSMPGGRPYGNLIYRRDEDGHKVRVGIRWDIETETPQTACLEEKSNDPLKNRMFGEADTLELDALARATAMMSIFSLIGATISNREMENAVLDASGLGLPRIYDEEPER